MITEQVCSVLLFFSGVMGGSLSDIIYKAADKYDIDPKLIAAVIQQESSGYPAACRYEQGFYDRYVRDRSRKEMLGYIPKATSLATERRMRAFSYGYGQLMGQTARELGFAGESLAELFDPETNIDLSAKLLRRLLDQSKGDREKALLRYNGGGDPGYPIKVLAHIDTGAIDHLLTR